MVTDRIQAPGGRLLPKITLLRAEPCSKIFVELLKNPSFVILRKGGQVVASGWDFWKHVKFDADGNDLLQNLSYVSDVFSKQRIRRINRWNTKH